MQGVAEIRECFVGEIDCKSWAVCGLSGSETGWSLLSKQKRQFIRGYRCLHERGQVLLLTVT